MCALSSCREPPTKAELEAEIADLQEENQELQDQLDAVHSSLRAFQVQGHALAINQDEPGAHKLLASASWPGSLNIEGNPMMDGGRDELRVVVLLGFP